MHLSPARILNFIRREAVLCCAALAALASTLFVPPSAAYISYFDFRVLCLLFCLMAVVAGLRGCGLFEALALRLLRGKKTLRFLALMLVLLPFFSSMLVTNDVALLTFVPFAILILNMADASAYAPYIIVLQTVAANLGSMATPVGNPQNLFLYNRFALSPADFFRTMLPLAAASLALLCMGVLFVPPRAVTVAMGDVHGYNTRRLPALSVLFVLCLLCVFRVAPYQLLTAVVLAMLTLFMRTFFGKWITACCSHLYFLYFRGQHGKDRRVNALLSALMDKHALPTCVLASQVVSNVPAAVLLSGFSQNWRVLLTGTNLGGLGTPIASLASLISLKLYARSAPGGTRRYLLVFSAVNVAALALLYALAAAG
ncbi:MAG: SLC13 family permease [Ruthenibacterium lactatiformans]